ncbi:MAG: hypothetical protein B7Z33_04905 [Sphingomonadales bacterium 12-68-11]|nr:MAG: hypothetical protein B7Z33_04905 [Sphingomonadales bacterium 12-68-11]
MIRRCLALLAALALAGCGEPEPAGPPPSPALWEVTAANGAKGWLFGTIHALPEGTRWRTPEFEQALADAEVLVVEIANLADSQAAASAFAAVARSPGLPPLLARVEPAAKAELIRALGRAGMTERDFATTESWAAALQIANAAGSGDSANGVDRALLTSGLPVTGLESFAAQFALFDRLPEPAQAELLEQAAADTSPEEEGALARAWLTGDLAALVQTTDRGLADPELRRVLLTGRNRAWAGRIAAMIEQGRYPLVAVGAGHMLGGEGLPALLAAQGYKVSRLQ